jgi:hypothetical protein
MNAFEILVITKKIMNTDINRNNIIGVGERGRNEDSFICTIHQ